MTPDAERSMNTFLGISEELSIEELDKDAIRASKYVYIEGYQVSSMTGCATAVEARRLADEYGVKTALSLSDPSMVKFFRKGLEDIVGDGVDLLFSNQEEAFGWAKTRDMAETIETLKTVAKTFVITLGSKGALVFDGQKLIEIPSFPVNAVDTNGAGDMFAGAFLYGLSTGYDFRTSGELASAAAAEVVSSFGPRLAPEKHQYILKRVLKR